MENGTSSFWQKYIMQAEHKRPTDSELSMLQHGMIAGIKELSILSDTTSDYPSVSCSDDVRTKILTPNAICQHLDSNI